jgi:hypothetical protein
MITSEFSESKYIGIAMMSMLQAASTGIPLLFVVREHPQAYYLILTFMIFVIGMVILVVIFVPKMAFALSLRDMDVSEQSRLIQECVQISLSAKQGATAESQGDDLPSHAFSTTPSIVGKESIILDAECSYARRPSSQRSALQESTAREAAKKSSIEFIGESSCDVRSVDFKSKAFTSEELATPEEQEDKVSPFE